MTQKADLFKGKGVVKHSEEINEMDVDGAMGNHLPQEMIMEIFSRLPVRPLFRFKCLSKFWMALISEPYFVRKHLNHARKNQNSQKIRIVNHNFSSQYCSSLTSASLSSVKLVEDVQQFYWLSSDKATLCQIYCCFDGLALVGVNECHRGSHIKLLLWNPSTRESIVLPHTDFLIPSKFTCGLGYDSTSDCYKILKVGHHSGSEILALKSGSWRETEKHPSGIYSVRLSTMNSLAFVHGKFHWLGSSLESLVSFDISNEEYAEIPLPDGMFTVSGNDYAEYGISGLGGMLCVHAHLSYKSHNLKFWVWKDYGVKESWNQLLNIHSTDLYSIIPKHMFSDGEVLLRCRHFERGGVFKTSKESSSLWFRSVLKGVTNGFVYTESLISPKLLTQYLLSAAV